MPYSRTATAYNVRIALDTLAEIEEGVAKRLAVSLVTDAADSPQFQRRVDRAVQIYCAERIAEEIDAAGKALAP